MAAKRSRPFSAEECVYDGNSAFFPDSLTDDEVEETEMDVDECFRPPPPKIKKNVMREWLSQDFIVGRTVVASNISLSSLTKSSDTPVEIGDVHLYLTQLETKPVDLQELPAQFKDNLSGVLVMELFYKNMNHESKVMMTGLLGFKCGREQRDEFLIDGVIPGDKITCPNNPDTTLPVVLIDSARLLPVTYPSESRGLEIMPMDKLISLTPLCLFDTGEGSTRTMPVNMIENSENSMAYITSSWLFPSFFDLWIANHNLICSVINTETDECEPSPDGRKTRPLQVHEFIYVYFLIDVRFPRKYSLDMHSFVTCMRHVRVDYPQTATDSELVEFYSGVNVNKNMLRIFNSLAVNHKELISMAIDQYVELYGKMQLSLKEAYRVGEAIEHKRKEYNTFPISTSLALTKVRVENIKYAPKSLMKPEDVKEWADGCIDRIENALNTDKVYKEVYDSITAVVAEDVPLRLYAKEGLFQLEYIQKFSTDEFTSEPLPPPGNLAPCFKNYQMPYDDKTICQSGMDRGAMYAAVHGTPIWQRQMEDENVYIMAREVNDNEDPTAYLTPYKIFSVMVADGGRNHEVQNSGMHISTLKFDIDLCPMKAVPDMDLTKLGKHCVSCSELVLDKIEVLRGRCVHYIYYSKPEPGDFTGRKFGVHHHIRLPDGVVMTFETAATLNDIMGEIRFLYADTIGQFCGEKDDDVYDPMIYKSHMKKTASGKLGSLFEESVDECMEGRISHRPLRLPNQKKRDKTKKLICIYRTDGKELCEEIPIEAKLTHGPMEAEFGTVIKKLDGHKPIHDHEYVRRLENCKINRYVRENCNSSGQGVMTAVNAKTILFKPEEKTKSTDGSQELELFSVKQLDELSNLINELWYAKGKSSMRDHLKFMTGHAVDDVYKRSDIENALCDAKIVYDEFTDKFLLTSNLYRDKFSLCPVRVHGTPHAGGGVQVQVYTESHMNRFGFSIGRNVTFKRCSDKYVKGVSSGMLYQHPICLFKSVANSVERELEKYNAPTISFLTMTLVKEDEVTGEDVYSPVPMDEVLDYKNMDLQFCYIDHEDNENPLHDLVHGVGGIQYLYAHYKNERGDFVTCFRSSINYFVLLCKTKTGECKPFACNNPAVFIDAISMDMFDDAVDMNMVRKIKEIMSEKDGQVFLTLNQPCNDEEDDENETEDRSMDDDTTD